MQRLIRSIYPSQCVFCDAQTESDYDLCGTCWVQTPFILGLSCSACGVPLRGEAAEGEKLLCDDCMTIARPWSEGRAVMEYRDKARRMILSLKHGDRTDFAKSAGPWLARSAVDLITPNTVIVPIPLHRARFFRRRFNQAALLADALAKAVERPTIPDVLLRVRKTIPLEGHSRDERFAALDGAFSINERWADEIKGRDILLVDDVMTSGATFAAATEVLKLGGARQICVLALARAVKDA